VYGKEVNVSSPGTFSVGSRRPKEEDTQMTVDKDTVVSFREEVLRSSRSAPDELVWEGARRILEEALELEVADFIVRNRESRDAQGRRTVVRNGYLPTREVVGGVGPLKVCQSPTRELAKRAFDRFLKEHEAKSRRQPSDWARIGGIC
jgi:hypothetical protein